MGRVGTDWCRNHNPEKDFGLYSQRNKWGAIEEKTRPDRLMEFPLAAVLVLIELIINSSDFNEVQVFGKLHYSYHSLNVNGSLQVRYQASYSEVIEQ